MHCRAAHRTSLLTVSWIASLVVVAACGPASDTVEVRLRTGLESSGTFKNLMNGLTAVPAFNGACGQKNLFGASSPGNDPQDQLDTFRIPLVTPMGTSGADYPIDALWISQYTTFPPVTVNVPRGTETGVGIIGALSWSRQTVPNLNLCSDFDGSGVPYSTTSVIGHTRVVANGPMDVPLKVWVLPASSTPYPTPAAGDPACASHEEENQNCPSQDFYILTCDNCQAAPQRHIRLEYAMDRQQPEKRVVQWIPAADIGYNAPLSVPNILPMRLQLIAPGTAVPIFDGVFNKSDFPNTGGPRTAIKSIPPGAGAPSGYQLTLTERPRVVPPTIPAFSLTSISQVGDDVQLDWAVPDHANLYEIDRNGAYLMNAGSPPFTINGLALSASHSLQVVAKNYQGSTPVTSSNTLTINPLPTFSTNPGPNGGTTGTIAVTCGTVTGATTYMASGQKLSGSGPANLTPQACSSGVVTFAGGGLTTGDVYQIKVTATNTQNGTRVSPTYNHTVP